MKMKIYTVSDIMLGEQQLHNNFQVIKTIRKNSLDSLFKNGSPFYKDGDIIFGHFFNVRLTGVAPENLNLY